MGELSGTALSVLIVAGEGVRAPALPGADALGAFATQACDGLEAAQAALVHQSFDAVVFALSGPQAQALPAWPAFSQAVGDSAVLVLCADRPELGLAIGLVRQGVQDVAPLAIDPDEGLPRALRLAVERKTQQRHARRAQGTDLMTGLPDQAQLLEQMSQLLAMREREPAPMALLAVRVEGLASVEARHGREAANALRRKIAVRLRVGLRAGDVVAALGPDLLGVLLARVQDPRDDERVAAKLVQALKAPFSVAGDEVAVAVAIGRARYPQDGKDAMLLLRRAAGLAASAPAVGRASDAAANDETR